MICPNCGKDMEEAVSVCPACGTALTAQEEAAEAPELETAAPVCEDCSEAAEANETDTEAAEVTESSETAEAVEIPEDAAAEEDPDAAAIAAAEAAQAAAEAEATRQKKQKKLATALITVIIVLLLAVIGCMGYALKHVSEGGSIKDLLPKHEKKLNASAVAVELTDEDGNKLSELTNAQFAYYYWGEYYYFVNYYGFYFDPATPLDEQVYQEADSAAGTEAMTWQDYFMQNAVYSYNQTQALICAAEAEGFVMGEDYENTYQQVIDALPNDAISAGFTDADGNADILAYVQESYGPSATIEDFQKYIHDSYQAAAYSDSVYYGFSYTDDQLSSYYDDNADTFLYNGVEKSEQPNINVRHILITPEQDTTDEDGNTSSSDDAWTAAEQQANDLLAQWKDGDATEDSFAALAQENSTDPGSSSNGGLYEDVYPGQMVTSFNDWCFDAARQAGDTAVVKTEYGYHIMYFVGTTDNYYWKTNVESELRYNDYNTRTEELFAKYTAALTEKADVANPDAVNDLAEQYASSNTDTTATQSAVG